MKQHFAYILGNECRKVVKYIGRYDGSCLASQ